MKKNQSQDRLAMAVWIPMILAAAFAALGITGKWDPLGIVPTSAFQAWSETIALFAWLALTRWVSNRLAPDGLTYRQVAEDTTEMVVTTLRFPITFGLRL